jgi:hypothetical protein
MRADGTGWDPKGPACVHRARAALDSSGKVLAYEFVSKGLSRVNITTNEADPRDSLAGMALRMPLKPELGLGVPAESYDFETKLLAWEVIAPLLERYSPLRTAHLRDPMGPEVHFGSEQFIDEVAVAAGEDPVAFRLKYVKEPRDAAVIKAAAEKAGWRPRPAGKRKRSGKVLQGRGISYAQRSGTVVAVVADIEVYPADGRIWARKFTVAHDCGLIVNPRGLRQTIEGNVVQCLSRTLFEEVQFDGKSVTSLDWGTYPILEIRDAPETIDCVLINHTEIPPSGAGEPTMRCVPAAVANAFFDATGVRIRRAPLTPERVKAALSEAGDVTRVALHELLEPFTNVRIDERAGRVELLRGLGNVQRHSIPGSHAERAHDGQPCGLREQRTEAAWRSAHDCDGPIAKQSGHVCRRSRQPVDRVLEHARNGVVVLRRNEEQSVRARHLLLQCCHRGWNALRLDVRVIERHAADGANVHRHRVGRYLNGSAKE